MDNKIIDFKNSWKKNMHIDEDRQVLMADKVESYRSPHMAGMVYSVYSAYGDSKRTFIFNANLSPEERHGLRNKALINLQDKLIAYLKSDDPNNYDFKTWADELIEDFNKCCLNMTYGKAQKIINMSFKYFYCCDDKPRDEMFYPCGMPLDSFILTWFKKIANIELQGWSNINSYELYSCIQEYIRKYLSKQDEFSKIPLFAEFDIWHDEVTKNVYFNLNEKTTDEDIKNYISIVKDKTDKL